VALSFASAFVSWAEEKGAKNTTDKEYCVTHRVINESTNFVSVITRCTVDRPTVDDQPKQENTSSSSKKNPQKRMDSLNERDLVAQQSMANSTYWIMWIPLGGLIDTASQIGFFVVPNELKRFGFELFFKPDYSTIGIPEET
jgi:hypothetical protein